ncbi:MAG: hypothetical protein RR945_00380 [Erysipelotrichaceae bacterium]
MASITKLLKYINKHPNCSYLEISTKIYNGNVKKASNDLMTIKQYITGIGTYHTIEGGAFKTIDNICLNALGKEFIENSLKEKIRFYGPFIISIFALIISAISLFISFMYSSIK